MLEYQYILYFMQGNHFFVKCLIDDMIDCILGNTTQVMLQDCDIQVWDKTTL